MINNSTELENRILSVITETYDIPLADIIRPIRRKEIAEARQTIAYCLRLMTPLSFPAIGKILGGRDHTTMMHSCSKIAAMIEVNQKFRSKIDLILNAIRNPDDLELMRRLQPDAEDISEPSNLYDNEVVVKEEDDVGVEEEEKKEDEKLTADELIEEHTVQYQIPTENLELSKRETEILMKYRHGMNLKEIGEIVNLTRERVRQIVLKAALKEVGNKVMSGFEIDAHEYIRGLKLVHGSSRNIISEDEKQKLLDALLPKAVSYSSIYGFSRDSGVSMGILTKSLPEIVEVIEKNSQEKKERWSQYYTKCRGCGTTKIPHLRKGFCQRCLGVHRGERRELLMQNKSHCEVCSTERGEAMKKYGRDLYIMKDGRVLCRGCFLQLTGRKLAESRGRFV